MWSNSFVWHAGRDNLTTPTKAMSGADPGFWERGGPINIFTSGGGYGRGRAPSRDSKGVWGSADSSPSGVWASGAKPQPLFAFAFI